MGKKKSYNDIRDYINGECGNGCEIITTKEEFQELIKYYQPTRVLLVIRCKCGSIFKRDFHGFKIGHKKCENCTKEIMLNKKSFNYAYIKKFIEEKDYVLVTTKNEFEREKYNKCPTQIKLIMKDVEGYFYQITYNHFSRGHIPNKFHSFNPYTIQNIKLWCRLNNTPFELISEKYKRSNVDMEWRCFKKGCQNIFKLSWNGVITGTGCGVCAGQTSSDIELPSNKQSRIIERMASH